MKRSKILYLSTACCSACCSRWIRILSSSNCLRFRSKASFFAANAAVSASNSALLRPGLTGRPDGLRGGCRDAIVAAVDVVDVDTVDFDVDVAVAVAVEDGYASCAELDC
jgi:hypothetical protein